MIETRLVDAIKDHLQRNLLEKSQLKVKVKVRLEYCLMVNKVNLYSAEEDQVKELYHAITGKPWTREVAVEVGDYDS